jgi:pilus assembly protein Flp/PilA
MMNLLKKLYRDEEGQGLAEYALILALVSLVVIASLNELGDSLKGIFTGIKNAIPDVVTE